METRIDPRKKSLDRAREKKDDEYYTFLEDVARGVEAIREKLSGAVVYCPCDDPSKSNFIKYLKENFTALGLKKILATWLGSSQAYQYDGKTEELLTLSPSSLLEENNGSFSSPSCVDLMKTADIIITNPPFSILREFYSQVRRLNKSFLIIAPLSLFSYGVVEEDVKNKSLFFIEKVNKFLRPSGDISSVNCGLFTNYKIERPPYYTGVKSNDLSLPRYVNYPAVNINSIRIIPDDYNDPIGVPISFLEKINVDQYDVLAIRDGKPKGKQFAELSKKQGARGNSSLNATDRTLGYIDEKGKAIVPFCRVIIKRIL